MVIVSWVQAWLLLLTIWRGKDVIKLLVRDFMDGLKNLVGTSSDIANRFIDTISHMGQNGASVPMAKMFSAFTLETIETVAFDEHLD